MNAHEMHLIALLVGLHEKLMGAKWSSVTPEEIQAIPDICDQLESRANQEVAEDWTRGRKGFEAEPEAEAEDVAPPPSEAPRVTVEVVDEAGAAVEPEIINCWCGLQIAADILHFPSHKPARGEEHYASRVKPTEQEEESTDDAPSGD